MQFFDELDEGQHDDFKKEKVEKSHLLVGFEPRIFGGRAWQSNRCASASEASRDPPQLMSLNSTNRRPTTGRNFPRGGQRPVDRQALPGSPNPTTTLENPIYSTRTQPPRRRRPRPRPLRSLSYPRWISFR